MKKVFALLMAHYCVINNIANAVEYAKHVSLYYDRNYPVHKIGDLSLHYNSYIAIHIALSHFDFALLSKSVIDFVADTYYLSNKTIIFPDVNIITVILPKQLFQDLDKFRALIQKQFILNDNVDYYLLLLNILANTVVDLSQLLKYPVNKRREIYKIALSVQHQQQNQIRDLFQLPRPYEIIPSEKLYHLTEDYVTEDLFYSYFICNVQAQALGLNYHSDVDSDWINLEVGNEVTLFHATEVKILLSTVKGSATLLPVTYTEYEQMQPWVSEQLPFSGQIDYDALEKDQVNRQKVNEVYLALINKIRNFHWIFSRLGKDFCYGN